MLLKTKINAFIMIFVLCFIFVNEVLVKAAITVTSVENIILRYVLDVRCTKPLILLSQIDFKRYKLLIATFWYNPYTMIFYGLLFFNV